MGSSFRQGVAHSNVETPLLIIGGVLLVAFLLTIFQQQLRKRRRQQYHPALDVQSSGVLGQIHRRKEDLNRFIRKLRTQLAARERQLQHHDELEDAITSRIEISQKQEHEWAEIMRAGKRLHGKKWTQAPAAGQPSLKELMEMHKEELLGLKPSIANEKKSSRAAAEKRHATRPYSQKQLTPRHHDSPISPRIIPPEWQSTRRTADSLAKMPLAAPTAEYNPWNKNNIQPLESNSTSVSVPMLDLTKLSKRAEDATGITKKSFEEIFRSQATLASSLKQKRRN